MSTTWEHGEDLADAFETLTLEGATEWDVPELLDELGLDRPDVHTFLDYGCGPGNVTKYFAECFDVEIHAVDISLPMLTRALRGNAHPDIHYHHIKSGSIPLADDSIDVALASFVFINIGDLGEIQKIAGEIHRVLRPAGRLVTMDTHPAATGVRFRSFQTGEPGHRYVTGELRQVRLYEAGDNVHLEFVDYHWPADSYVDTLRKAGFSEVRTTAPLPRHPSEPAIAPFLIVNATK